MAQLLSHPPADLMAEHFHLSKTHVPDIDVSIVDPLLHEFLRKSINKRIQRPESVIHDRLRERKLRILRPFPEFTKKQRLSVLTFSDPQ
jgi:hypothetical protein